METGTLVVPGRKVLWFIDFVSLSQKNESHGIKWNLTWTCELPHLTSKTSLHFSRATNVFSDYVFYFQLKD